VLQDFGLIHTGTITEVPRLKYTPPSDLYHSALRPPEVYESTRVNASLQVYDFQEAPPGG